MSRILWTHKRRKKNTSEILFREEPAERQFDGMEAAALKKFVGHRYVLALVFFCDESRPSSL